MKALQRKTSILSMTGLLVGAGVLIGIGASSYASEALIWQPPPQTPVTDGPVATPVDQASAGQGWARTAFDGGLRECPKMNAAFLAACEAEMKKLIERPAFPAGSYGGPLLITKIEQSASEDAWAAQERLEEPRDEIEPTGFDPLPYIAPEEPAFERTPDNYPAAPEDGFATLDDAPPPTPR